MKIIKYLTCLYIFCNINIAQAECSGLKDATNIVHYRVIGADSPIISAKATAKNVYIEFKDSSNWPVPFIKTDKNKDFYLRWEEEDGCMKIFTSPQDFLIGDYNNTWELKVHKTVVH